MTIAYDGHRGSAFEKASDTSLALTVANANIPAGSLVIFRAVTDNFATASGESTEHSVADSQLNTWTLIKEHTISPTGAAADGVTTSLWRSILATGLTSGTDTVTLTCANAVTAKAIALEEFTGTNLTFESASSVAQTVDPRDVTLGSLTSREHLLIAMSGVEGTGLFTSEDADYTSFATNVIQTTGSAAASNVTQFGGYRIATLTTDTRTVDLSAARDGVDILGAFYEGSGGTQTPQAVAGTVTTAGALVNQARKPLGGSITPAGALILQGRKVLAGTLTMAGTLANSARKVLAGALTTAGDLVASKLSFVSLGGTLTTAGALVNSARKVLAGSLTPDGALSRSVSKVLSGSISPDGSLLKRAQKVLAGALSPDGTLGEVKTALISLAGSLGISGALSNQARKGLSGSITPDGSLVKQAQKSLSSLLSPDGGHARQVGKVLAGALAPAGELVRLPWKVLAGNITPDGALSRLTGKALGGVLSPDGTLARLTARILAGALSWSGALDAEGGEPAPEAPAETAEYIRPRNLYDKWNSLGDEAGRYNRLSRRRGRAP